MFTKTRIWINRTRCICLLINHAWWVHVSIYLFNHEAINTCSNMKLIIHTISFIPPLRFWRALSSHVSKIDQTESAIHISGCTLEDSFQGREVIKKNGSITIRNLINWKKCVTNNWILSLTWRVKFVIKRDLYDWIFIHKSQFCKGKGKSQLLAWERLFWEPPYV